MCWCQVMALTGFCSGVWQTAPCPTCLSVWSTSSHQVSRQEHCTLSYLSVCMFHSPYLQVSRLEDCIVSYLCEYSTHNLQVSRLKHGILSYLSLCIFYSQLADKSSRRPYTALHVCLYVPHPTSRWVVYKTQKSSLQGSGETSTRLRRVVYKTQESRRSWVDRLHPILSLCL